MRLSPLRSAALSSTLALACAMASLATNARADLIDDLRRALDASAGAVSVAADLPGAVEAPASISPASVEPAVVVA